MAAYRPVPDDFREVAPTMTTREARKHYKVSSKLMQRWYKDAGVRSLNPHPIHARMLPVPEGFVEQAARQHLSGLCRQYNVSKAVIERWLRETGTTAQPYGNKIVPVLSQLSTGAPKRDTTLHGLAAEVLRKYAPVYRCDYLGRALLDGFFWRFGNVILTEDELLQRAESKGFTWRAAA